jgi:hypothetical protein
MNSNLTPAPQSKPSDPLAQLADIHLPPAVASFPWALGWWLLLGLSLAILIAGLLWLRSYRRRNAYRRAALLELEKLSSCSDDAEFASQVNQLLRRAALHAYPSQHIAGLSGEAWIDFLLRSSGPKSTLSASSLEGLLNNAYRNNTGPLDRSTVSKECQLWLRRHRSRYV